jgi:hypothetical protein
MLKRSRRSPGVLVAAASLLLAAAGCGAGQVAATGDMVPSIPGVDADAGPIALRNLLIPYRPDGYPAGSDVPLIVRIVSDATQPVTLTQITPGPPGKFTVAAQRIVVVGATPMPSGPAPTPSGPAAAAPILVVPSGQILRLVPPAEPYLRAEKIAATLTFATTLPVRFTFSTGDSAVVEVPMAPPAYPVDAGGR